MTKFKKCMEDIINVPFRGLWSLVKMVGFIFLDGKIWVTFAQKDETRDDMTIILLFILFIIIIFI